MVKVDQICAARECCRRYQTYSANEVKLVCYFEGDFFSKAPGSIGYARKGSGGEEGDNVGEKLWKVIGREN